MAEITQTYDEYKHLRERLADVARHDYETDIDEARRLARHLRAAGYQVRIRRAPGRPSRRLVQCS